MMQIARSTTADERTTDVRGRSEEMSALFYAEYPGLWAVAFAMLGDRHLAEEIVMDAFTKAFSSWGRMRRLDYPPGYLKKIVVNLCRSRLRRKAIELRVNALAKRRDDRDVSRLPGSDTRLDVWMAIRDLSPMQRACIVLKYFDDMTEAQVAETLDCSVGTVKSHIFRARKSLEKTMEDPRKGRTDD